MVVFFIWASWDHWFNLPRSTPGSLAEVSPAVRTAWILFRVLGAVVTVPLAEELAYRGYLMRRLKGEDFETISFQSVGWLALLISSLIFGVSHGNMWLPAIVAGLIFGLLAMRSGRIGEAVAAHAVANSCIAAYVLLFDQWQLW
jgi:CAAX prenyl protease-like protein